MPPGDTHESRLGTVTPLDPELIQVDDAIGQRAQRRGLVQGSVRPVPVVGVLVIAQHDHQMPLIQYQGPVQQLTPAAADSAFHDRIAPHRQLHPIRMIGTSVSGVSHPFHPLCGRDFEFVAYRQKTGVRTGST